MALPDYFDDYDKEIDSDHISSSYFSKGNNQLRFEVFNKSGNQKKFKDCPVGRIEYDFSGSLMFYMAGDFLLNGRSCDEVEAKFGKPASREDYDTGIEIVYEKSGSEWIYERYTLQFNTETRIVQNINIVNFIKTETVENDNSDTAYLSKYKAPSSLGSNPMSFNVSIMGDLYTLPAPVSEFEKNGWEIIESCNVGAGTYSNEEIVMKKDGVVGKFGVFNFSRKQVDAKDATIYKIDVDNYNPNIKLILPGNISLGTPKSEVEKALRNIPDFSKENTVSNCYVYSNIQQKSTISIHIFESGTVESITVFQKECPYK